ncbi:response regulator [Notoacmeibacter marinus]|uniref:response regulator n=1 Tax=Notoacmeibacter marinus TaxID=1876515 RepID=UPI0013B0600F|nr:response regulator [Notoacmeibacter marinus]
MLTLTRERDVTIEVAGQKIHVGTTTERNSTEIVDLQERLATVEEIIESAENIKFDNKTTVPDQRDRIEDKIANGILWVDDFPENNIFLIRSLREEGLKIDFSSSTEDGFQKFVSGEYRMIISDLGRIEEGIDNPFAGRDLIEKVRRIDQSVPIVIFAGERGMKHADDLKTIGATDVTNSNVALIKSIRQALR